MRNRLWVIVFVLAAFAQAHADAAFLLEEPFGMFGSLNPTGHAAVYLTRVCAASPTRLRRCERSEAGVIISRYYKIGGYDWLVIPLLRYVYAVDSPQDIPRSANAQSVAALRDAYRRDHLLAIAPSNAEGRAPEGEWVQLIGSAYDRKIYGFRIATSPGQDDAFIKQFNNQKNKSHFNLLFHNCADFARTVLNFYYPHAVRRNLFADAGIMTLKQVAKSIASYCRHHPDVMCSSFAIPQVSGSIHRSGPADDLFEALLNTKKYVLPRALLRPVVKDSLAVTRLIEGRFNTERNTIVFDVDSAVQAQSAGRAISVVPNLTFESRISSAIALKGAEQEWGAKANSK